MFTAPFVTRFVAFFVLFGASSVAYSQVTPAILGDAAAEKFFVGLIEFPETHGDATVNLQCVTVLKSNGKMKDAGCYINNNWEPEFVEAIQKAAKKAVLIPAKEGKNGREVALMFRVEFLKRTDEKTINVYLNPGIGEMVEEYGQDHISAQRVMGKERWQKACPTHARWLVHARAHVNEEGQASSVELEHGGGIVPPGQCQQALVDTITGSKYAPATVDGIPVPSSYVEPFGS